jgi:hypothetical protein
MYGAYEFLLVVSFFLSRISFVNSVKDSCERLEASYLLRARFILLVGAFALHGRFPLMAAVLLFASVLGGGGVELDINEEGKVEN